MFKYILQLLLFVLFVLFHFILFIVFVLFTFVLQLLLLQLIYLFLSGAADGAQLPDEAVPNSPAADALCDPLHSFLNIVKCSLICFAIVAFTNFFILFSDTADAAQPTAGRAPPAGCEPPGTAGLTAADMRSMFEGMLPALLEAHFQTTRSTSAGDCALAVSKRQKLDAESIAAEAAKAAAAVACIRVATFQELAAINGFDLETADEPSEPCNLICFASRFLAKKSNTHCKPINHLQPLSVQDQAAGPHAVHRLSSSLWAAETERRRAGRDIGMIVGHSAFQLTEGGSYLGFERLLPLQHLNGADIGNLNHSEIFFRQLLPNFTAPPSRRTSAFSSALARSCWAESFQFWR